MTIIEANEEIEHLNNQINYLYQEKERIFYLTQPQATKFDGERVSGGIRRNKLDDYAIQTEIIDNQISDLKGQLRHLMNYVENELKTISKYKPLEAAIIKDREELHLYWYEIANKEGFCERQCRRIYDKYKFNKIRSKNEQKKKRIKSKNK